MRKSSKIKLCFLSVSAALVAVAAVGCGKGNHEHEYSSEWTFNAEKHWNPATCSHDTKANVFAHTYTDTVIPPSATSAGYTLHLCACGYSYATDQTDSLPVEAGNPRYNENGHWDPVLSGSQIQIESHRYDETTIAPTCNAFGYTKHSCECGYWYASNAIAPITHTIDSNVWGHDVSSHWNVALCCGVKIQTVAHDYETSVTAATCNADGYTEFTCRDCGYSYRGRNTAASHAFSETLAFDEYEHWRSAVCEHTDQKADAADHVLIGTSAVCKVCNKTVSPRLAYELSADGQYYIVTGMGCFNGKAIEIPALYRGKRVEAIGDRAFKDSEITSVVFGANVKKIGARAFENTKLTAISLGSSVVSVSNAAFRDCINLSSAQIAGDKLVLSPYVFAGCLSLQTVTYTGVGKVKEVGAQAFSNCVKLTAIDLSACEKVGFAAFGGCEKLSDVTSLEKLSVADEYAFSQSALQSVTLPATLSQLGDNLFNGCTKLTSVTLFAKGIGKSAFEGCSVLATATLNGVELIGENAFKGCAGLTALTLPDTIVGVGENAFTGTGLIAAEGGVQYAANVAIGVQSGTTAATIKAGVVGIADGAFAANKTLTGVTLNDVRFIGVNAFRGCDKLATITFTDKVKYVGANAFRESGLTSVILPQTVQIVGDNAFYDCKSLVSVSVSASKIGRFAFSYTGVNRTLNSTVKQRPDYAKLKNLTIGDGVVEIASNAFQYCLVTSVTLPSSLASIGKYAFAQTELSGITVPASVTRIGEYAFYQTKLTSATFADPSNWKAGATSLNLATPTQNATLLKTTYVDIDWIKG